MGRTATYMLVILAGSALVAVGLTYDIGWLTGLAMLAVGLAFAAGFWVAPAPVDPDSPAYDGLAVVAPTRGPLMPEAPMAGMGVLSAMVVGSVVVAAGLLYDIGWLTGLSMLAVGAMFAVGFWIMPKARA